MLWIMKLLVLVVIWVVKWLFHSGLFLIYILEYPLYRVPADSFLHFILSQLYIPLFAWVAWWHIRLVIRLITKDKQWGSIRRALKKKKRVRSMHKEI